MTAGRPFNGIRRMLKRDKLTKATCGDSEPSGLIANVYVAKLTTATCKTFYTFQFSIFIVNNIFRTKNGAQCIVKTLHACIRADFLKTCNSLARICVIFFSNGISQAYNFKTRIPFKISLIVRIRSSLNFICLI